MFKTPRKALGFKRPNSANKDTKGCKAPTLVMSDEKAAEIKAAREEQDRIREEKRQIRTAVIQKHAPNINELAETALVAVQELMAAELAARNELGEGDGPFSSDEITLEEAEHAISIARFSAADALKSTV